jgi:hypothetical protein
MLLSSGLELMLQGNAVVFGSLVLLLKLLELLF